MATYYWYGGTGNWSDYTNRWSTNSGNSPAAPAPNAPTSADNVIFDDNSHSGTFTVTVDTASNCADFTCSITNAAKKMTLTGSSALNVFGSWSNPGSTFYATTYSGTTTFSATTTGKTITTNAVTMAGVVTFSGNSGEWTLGGAFTSGSTLNINMGSLVTNNNNLSAGINLAFPDTTDAKSLTLGSSTVTVVGLFGGLNSTNTTINAGTSSIVLSNSNTGFYGMGKTYYNVSFTGAGAGGIVMFGANTFNNLTYSTRSATGFKFHTFESNIIVNGTLTLGATNTAIRRMFIASNTIGTQRTITLNGTLAALADVDFRDINAAGTVATPWTGTRLGNAKGNSNITTDAPKTVYWNLAGSQSWSATGWATTNNGSPAVNNFPLAQDTATFTEAGSAGTVTIDAGWNIGNIQMADGVSNRTTAFTLATGTTTPVIYGDVTFFSSLTLSGTGAITFAGQGGTQTITPAGISFTQPWAINSATGTLTLAANTTLGSTLATTLTSGTFNVNGKTFTTGTFVTTGTLTRAITFGTSGKIVVAGSGASAWNASGSGFTNTGTTATISMTSASAKTFVGGGYTYAATLSQDGAGALTISGNNTFANITNTTQPVTITFTAGTTQTVSTFTASGTAGNLVTLQSSSAGSRFTISDSSGYISVSYCSIKDSAATGGAVWEAFTSNGNVNGGNNTGWDFSVPDVVSYTMPIELRSFTERRGFN